jgi:hypothetical protein
MRSKEDMFQCAPYSGKAGEKGRQAERDVYNHEQIP